MLVVSRTKNLSTYYGEFIREHWGRQEATATAGVLLLGKPGEKPRNIIVTSGTPGIDLDAKLCKGYISRIISGELDSILFKGYGKQGFKLKLNIAGHQDDPPRVRYVIQANKSMAMRDVAYITGIHTTQFIFRQNPGL